MIDSATSQVEELDFDRDAIVRAALRAYLVEALRGLGRHNFPSVWWTGDLQEGGFYNGNGSGDYDVVVWTEGGVVGFAFEEGFGPIEQLGLAVDAVTGGPDDVRAAVPDLPDELGPVFVKAVSLLNVGNDGEKLAGVGFWLYRDRLGGTLFDDDAYGYGSDRLFAWGLLQGDRLPHACGGGEFHFHNDEPEFAPFNAVIDALTARALEGPTELTPEELATLLYPEYPKYPDDPEPDPNRLLTFPPDDRPERAGMVVCPSDVDGAKTGEAGGALGGGAFVAAVAGAPVLREAERAFA